MRALRERQTAEAGCPVQIIAEMPRHAVLCCGAPKLLQLGRCVYALGSVWLCEPLTLSVSRDLL